MANPHSPIIELDSIDSTNNYAMQLIDANKAQNGMTIRADMQLEGRGQRGKTWSGQPGESLMMSIIAFPQKKLHDQFRFNAAVAVAVANVLIKSTGLNNIKIKWPNDIIINDKKAGGILIENVIKGSQWYSCVIGIGLNVRQSSFSPDLPFATSLRIESGKDLNITTLCTMIRDAVMEHTGPSQAEGTEMEAYNQLLYRRGMLQNFRSGDETISALILEAAPDGTLALQHAGGAIIHYQHGQVLWVWE